MSRFTFVLAIVLAFAPAGSEGFQNSPEYNPYLPNKQLPPMIYGNVVSVTDHSMTVASIQGERITFDVDSRSVMPARLDEGNGVKVEFHLMESGRYLAKRVTPVQPGEMPTAMNQPYEETTTTSSTTYETTPAHQHGQEVVATETTTSTTTTEQTDATTTEGVTNVLADEGALPSTASPRPLIEWLGALGIASGTVLWLLRRRRRTT